MKTISLNICLLGPQGSAIKMQPAGSSFFMFDFEGVGNIAGNVNSRLLFRSRYQRGRL